jgi:hypothetical protein
MRLFTPRQVTIAIAGVLALSACRHRGGPMNLTDAQVQAVAACVWTLSHK